jgi:hypothetical protein
VDSLYESFEVQALRVRTEQAHVELPPLTARSEVPSNGPPKLKQTPGQSADYSNGRLNGQLLKILGNWGEK